MRYLTILILLILTACVPLVKIEQPTQTGFIHLEAGRQLGQTFTGRYNGLEGISLYLKPGDGDSKTGNLVLSLRASPQATADLESVRLPLKDVTSPGYYRLNFPSIQKSTNQDFYFEATIEGSGSLEVATGPGFNYLSGGLYLDGEPLDAQVSFRLAYDLSQVITGLMLEGLTWLAWLMATVWLFLLPGWGLAALVWGGWRRLLWPEKLGLAAGLSISLYPILFLWASLVGLRLGAAVAWLPPLFGGIALLWTTLRYRKLEMRDGRSRAGRRSLFTVHLSPAFWPSLAYIIVLALIIFTRFWTVRTLDFPLWGDSYQHTLIAQLLVDHGGLFNSWAPYADLQSFTYHFGFHTLVAAYHWLTGFNLSQATLWTGQILNVLAVACLYPLAARIGRNPWAGVLAVLVAGLLSAMPMFYVNWGRYTQLAGQVILPVAMYLVWELLSPRGVSVGASQEPGVLHSTQLDIKGASLNPPHFNPIIPVLILASIALAGLGLTHYRILIFAVIFIIPVTVLYLRREQWRVQLVSLLCSGLLAGLLVLPWYVHIYGDKIMQLLVHRITTPASQVSEATQQFNAIGDLSTYLPVLVWAALLLAVAWAIWKREKAALMIVFWWLLVMLAANPQWLGLPGTGAIGSFTVLIAAYIPAALLIGAAGGWLIKTLADGLSSRAKAAGTPTQATRTLPALTIALVSVTVIILGLAGAVQRLRDVHVAQNALAVRPDMRAATWIRANTPQDAHFLVNSFFAFGDSLIAGSDGGLWLPLLAGRSTTLPPINYTLEDGPPPDYVAWTNALTAAIQVKGISDPHVIAMLKERGITHVYIGQQQGRVNSPGPLIDPAQMLADPHYTLLYHQDQVFVFGVNP